MAIVRFAFVVGNEVSHVLEVDEDDASPVVPRMIAAYRTSPLKFVEVLEGDVHKDWTWDGVNFYPPTE